MELWNAASSATAAATADIKIRTKYTSGAQVSEITTYVKGERQRVEFPGVVSIEQGDLAQTIVVNLAAKTYFVTKHADVASAAAAASTAAPGADALQAGLLGGYACQPHPETGFTPFAFAKATEGRGYVDPRFGANWAGMLAAGLLLLHRDHFLRASLLNLHLFGDDGLLRACLGERSGLRRLSLLGFHLGLVLRLFDLEVPLRPGNGCVRVELRPFSLLERNGGPDLGVSLSLRLADHGPLLAAVVVKLLLIDLSGSGTVTRIVSFIGVGVLMLVIGYVAPLPSKEKPHAAL